MTQTVPLSKLKKGARAHIERIAPNPVFGELDVLVGRRLADLGFSDGVPLMVIATGLLGNGPFAVRLGNQSQFALRQPEADKILCRVSTHSDAHSHHHHENHHHHHHHHTEAR